MILRLVLRSAATLIALAVIGMGVYAVNVTIGYFSKANVDGTIAHLPLQAPVQILRDDRGVPHIRAQNEHDLFFAQGYVEGQDRLFQLDLIRRFVYGRLAEILGAPLLRVDEAARVVPVREIVARQWEQLGAQQRMMLTAFADGVNASAEREPTPVEFRALGYRMEPWQPQDALAVGFATVLDLTDTWNDIAARSGKVPLSEPCFDAPVLSGLDGIANSQRCSAHARISQIVQMLHDGRPPIGSNEWAAGAKHTATSRALLANDPHLSLNIPGVWYLVDLQAPGFHAAGVTLAGTPGIILGHNDHIAWGATNGTVASLSVFAEPANRDRMHAARERFHVRFGRTVKEFYYRSETEFEAPIFRHGSLEHVVVRWPAYEHPVTPLSTFVAFDRARSIEDALRALRAYPGPTQNFEIADTSGRVAYQLAGEIPNDPVWATRIHPASDLIHRYASVPFDTLPRIAPSRSAIVWTSNNKMYGPRYPLRLSPEFAPPCRAFRVATLLRDRPRYDVAYFARMQMDAFSPCELALARAVPMLAGWNGEVRGDSTLATRVVDLRDAYDRTFGGMTRGLLAQPTHAALLRTMASNVKAKPQPWDIAGARHRGTSAGGRRHALLERYTTAWIR